MSEQPIQHYTPDPEDQEDPSAYDHVTGHLSNEDDDLDLFLDELEVYTG